MLMFTVFLVKDACLLVHVSLVLVL